VSRDLPALARALGYAGLLPQVFAVLATFDAETRFIGLAAGYFYAALILSFLGGLWWGVAATSRDAPGWLWAAAIAPSLIAFASGIPWMIGGDWPGPSLIILGVCLIGSLLVDRSLSRGGFVDDRLYRLRVALSLGLGGLTILLGVR